MNFSKSSQSTWFPLFSSFSAICVIWIELSISSFCRFKNEPCVDKVFDMSASRLCETDGNKFSFDMISFLNEFG